MKNCLPLLRSLTVLLLLFSHFHLTAQNNAYLVGDANNNEVYATKVYNGTIYMAGRNIVAGQVFGFMSAVDPTNGNVLWTTRLPVESSLLDFVQDETGGFIAIGRDEPIRTNTGWQDTECLIARFDAAGTLVQFRQYDLQNNGRESFLKILDNPNPDPDNVTFRYYVLGISDKDPIAPTATDFVTLTTFDINLNINASFEYDPGGDNQIVRSFRLVNDGSGDMVALGDTDNNNGSFLVLGNDGNVQNLGVITGNNINSIYDALSFPTGEFVFVGSTLAGTNFITRVNSTGLQWTFQIPVLERFDGIVEVGGDYFVITASTISKIEDQGNTARLLWTRTIADGDGPRIPKIDLLNDNLVLTDVRVPNTAVGDGQAAGFGGDDVLVTVSDTSLALCLMDPLEVPFSPITPNLAFPTFNPPTAINIPPPTTGNTAIAVDFNSEAMCAADCGEVVRDTLIADCGLDNNTYTYTFQVMNNTPDYTLTSISIQNIMPSGVSMEIPLSGLPNVNPPHWVLNGAPPFNMAQIPPSGMSDDLTVTIDPGFPITEPLEICFDIVYYSDTYECCRFTHCITLLPNDPCANLEVVATEIVTEIQTDECCYSIELFNGYCPDYFVGIVTEIVTPGVEFSGIDGGSTWMTDIDPTNKFITWLPAGGGTLPEGTIGDMVFCLTNINTATQIPQEVLFHWVAVDPATGEAEIVCTTSLEFNCEPCMTFVVDTVITNPDNTYTVDFTVTNNSDEDADKIVFEYPANIFFDPSIIIVNIAAGATYSGTFTIYDLNMPPLGSGSIINFKAILENNDGWCCHLDDLEIELGGDCFGDCMTLEDDILAGFNFEFRCDNGELLLNPLRANLCDTVIWELVTDEPFARDTTVGRDTMAFPIPLAREFFITMTIIRYDENGNRCLLPTPVFSSVLVVNPCPPIIREIDLDLKRDTRDNNAVFVNWSVGLKSDIEEFSVVRYYLNNSKVVARVKAQPGQQHYNIREDHLPMGTLSYEVLGRKQKEQQAISERRSITLQDQLISNTVQLFPNPAKESLNLSLPQPGRYSLIIMDNNGNRLRTKQVEILQGSNIRFMINDLPQGLYMMKVQKATGESETKRFLKL